MPLYEYECKKCHHRFEKIQKFSDPHVKKCPKCSGPIEQVISAPAVQFKGVEATAGEVNLNSCVTTFVLFHLFP